MTIPLLRSETIRHGTIVTSIGDAHATLMNLGTKCNVHFEDENEGKMSRPYNAAIQRLENMELKITRIFEHIKELPYVEVHTSDPEEFLKYGQQLYDVSTVEEQLNEHYERFQIFKVNNDALLADRNQTLEEWFVNLFVVQLRLMNVIEGVKSEENSSIHPMDASEDVKSLSETNMRDTLQYHPADAFALKTQLSVLAGTINTAIRHRFVRSVFTISRGSAYIAVNSIRQLSRESFPKIETDKDVFFIYFHGAKGSYLYETLVRLCLAFNANLVSIGNVQNVNARIAALRSSFTEKQKAVDAYHHFMSGEIAGLLEITKENGNSLLEDWRLFIMMEKSIYTTLNKFRVSESVARCGCWFREDEEEKTRVALASHANRSTGSFLLTDSAAYLEASKKQPPSYVRSSNFFHPFQMIVDMYGLPTYKEVNPGLFTIIGFPFLFGIMFGDVGHGLVLLLLSLYLLSFKSESASGSMSSLYAFRHLLLLMSFFAIFCGSLYNEFFGVGLDFFGSRWEVGNASDKEYFMVPSATKSFPYPYGMDPSWRRSTNELPHINSFKMKFSVEVAFCQMLLGICLKGVNVIYWRNKLELYSVVIPRIVFFLSFVGYLTFLIVFKWVTSPSVSGKPSLISTFIGVFLMTDIVEGDLLFDGQEVVQTTLLVLMFVALPILLITKPSVEYIRLKRRHTAGAIEHIDDFDSSAAAKADYTLITTEEHAHTEEAHSMLEEIMHHLIECIEFLLGVLSNTASYLRLWALSLAHAELSKIILEQVFLLLFTLSDELLVRSILLYVATIVFAVLTVSIIMLMDLIEAFLHAVRLQWVEFQNKFYEGAGYAFEPFSIKASLESKPE